MNLGVLTAILAVVDKISPEVSKIGGNVKNAMGGVKAAIAAAFTVTAITGFISQFTELTGKITDQAAKLGISTTAVQEFEIAFGQAGVSMDAVGTAIGEMGKRLVSGDAGAVNALKTLGLNTADLLKLNPDQAFTRIADAVAGIPNPLERATAAQEIFGKGGKEILAGLDGHLAETTEHYRAMGLVLDEEVVAAGDEFGDVLGVLQTAGMALIAQVLKPLLPALTGAAQLLTSLASNAVPFLQQQFNNLILVGMQVLRWLYDFGASAAELGSKIPVLGKAFGATADAASVLRQKAQEMTDQIKMFSTEVPKVEAPVKRAAAIIGTYGENLKKASEDGKEHARVQALIEETLRRVRWQDAADRVDQLRESIRKTNEEIRQHVSVAGEVASVMAIGVVENTYRWIGALEQLKPALADAKVGAKGLGDVLQHDLLGVLQSIPGTIASALQGGGGLGGALKSIASQVGSALGGNLGTMIGGPLGGKIGSALGSFAGPLAGMLGNLFGKAEGKKANDLRDQIVSTAGGIQELSRRAVEAGTSVDALLRARDTKGVQAAWDALNGQISAHAEQMALAKQAMEEFGISADQAGQAFKQAQMDETAIDITKKLEAMMAVGVSTDAIIAGAGDEIGAFIQRAIEMGTTVPKEWEPIVQKMIAAGTLIDANGDKFTEMSQVPFAETLNDKISGLIDKLGAFFDQIGEVIGRLGRIPRTIDVDINGHWNQDGDFPRMAAGGVVTRPTMALIGEAGPEAVIPLARMGAAGGGVTVHVDARGALFDDFGSQQRLADLVSDAVMAKVQARTRVGFAGLRA